jgi:hypothetical protein
MSKVPRVGDLQIDQDLDFQRREWTAQRIGWAAMGLVALAGLAGVFGHGPVARAEARNADGSLRLQYERFARKRAEGTLQLRLGSGVAVADTVRVWIDRPTIEALGIQQITPEPAGVDAGADQYVYSFTVADGAAPATILFDIEPDEPGWHRGRIGVAGREALSFGQFVYP